MPHLRLRPLALAAVLVAGAAALLQPGIPAPAMARPAPAALAGSPFIGLWELDLTRMPANYGTPPKRVTFKFEDVGSGEWVTTVDITAPDDSVRHAVVRYRRDGSAVKPEHDIGEADAAAFNSPAPNVLVMNFAKNGASAGVRVYAISADGKEMTESAANVDAQGVPFVRNFHFRRIG
ncbi:MAG: hypothetical protein ACAH11_10330 [Sphingomonas sp.]